MLGVMTELAIEATGLTKSFGATKALAGVDLAARPGTVHAVLGPNGAGKPVTELRRSLLPVGDRWIGKRLVLPVLGLLKLLSRQILDKDDGGVPGRQLTASDGFADVEFPEHSGVRLRLAGDLSEPLVAEHGSG
jgi:hypothetical protein